MRNSDKEEVIDSAISKATENHGFTPQEIAALKEVADAWRGLEAFGRVAGVVRTIAIYVGWMIAAWLAIKYAAQDWVTGIKK
jgi:hypothetical protein